MDNSDEKFEQFWGKVVNFYWRLKEFTPTTEELRRETEQLISEPLSDDEIDRIVSAVISGDGASKTETRKK